MESKVKKFLDIKKLMVELLGTMALTYVGSWACIQYDMNKLSRSGVALAHSLVLLVFIYFGASISGAHYNPALTIATLVLKKIELTVAVFYVMA